MKVRPEYTEMNHIRLPQLPIVCSVAICTISCPDLVYGLECKEFRGTRTQVYT